MNASALQARIARHHEHAQATFRLDDELGTAHGLAWADFVLLDALDCAGGELPLGEIANRLGLPGSRFLLQVLPMEKLGLLQRQTAQARGTRLLVLRAPGRRLLQEARETAAAACAAM